MNTYEDVERLEKLLNELRTLALRNVPTKNDIIPKEEDLSASNLNDVYDIDIFFSRKPGMRRSVQVITSGLDKTTKKGEINFRISAMTALSSLCDTLIANGLTEQDIKEFMTTWIEYHHKNRGGNK